MINNMNFTILEEKETGSIFIINKNSITFCHCINGKVKIFFNSKASLEFNMNKENIKNLILNNEK